MHTERANMHEPSLGAVTSKSLVDMQSFDTLATMLLKHLAVLINDVNGILTHWRKTSSISMQQACPGKSVIYRLLSNPENRINRAISRHMPLILRQSCIDLKRENMKLCTSKKLPINRLPCLYVSIVMNKWPVFSWPRRLRPAIDFKRAQLAFSKICCIPQPVWGKDSYWLMYGFAILFVVRPEVLSAVVEFQIKYRRTQLLVNDVEIPAIGPVIPQVQQSQITSPVLKQYCVKLLGPHRKMRLSYTTTSNGCCIEGCQQKQHLLVRMSAACSQYRAHEYVGISFNRHLKRETRFDFDWFSAVAVTGSKLIVQKLSTLLSRTQHNQVTTSSGMFISSRNSTTATELQ